jgi:hypothetical protein
MQATKLCPSPHLEAADLCGKDNVVTIKTVGFSLVGEAKVNKGVVYYDEFDRGMVLNRTNLKRVIALHGAETDKWIGKKITLYPSETDFQGKTVPCIRVRTEAVKE